jgi:2-polyprenyl-3-methyl-5-hydroxy-6-metoxy-1,4-benzoquinol methylase
MTERPPLLVFADLLYRHEYSLAQRSERMGRFLASGSIDLATARRLIDEEAKTNPYAQFHAVRFLDLLRALSAVCDRLGVTSPRVLDCGIGPLTRIYRKVISGIRLQTTGLPRRVPTDEIAQRFDSSCHRYVDLDVESLGEVMPEWQGELDVVVFAEVIDLVRASPVEQITDLLSMLRPGGYLIVSTPNALSRGYVARLLTGRLITTIYQRDKVREGRTEDLHVREYTPLELHEAVAAAGGEIEQEGLFDWYEGGGDREIEHVSGREAMMFIIRRPD